MLQETSSPNCMYEYIERHSVVVNILTWKRLADVLYHQVFCQLMYTSIEDITHNGMSH